MPDDNTPYIPPTFGEEQWFDSLEEVTAVAWASIVDEIAKAGGLKSGRLSELNGSV